MTFLQPSFLLALPLAAAPIIIHLIHLYRRRQVKWAAMMFLRAAQRMNKGLSRLRQILILAFRAMAVAGILFVVTRPLAGGWLGLTGGAPDTVLVLLDRSASMEQQNLSTGVSKRSAGLRKVAQAIEDAVGSRSKLVFLESAIGQPLPVENPKSLPDLPQAEGTSTAADLPALLQKALDYITTNKTGRTDIWVVSDLQRSDWDAAGGRWAALRGGFASLQGIRFHLLAYPQAPADDFGITMERVTRHADGEKAELLFDLRVVHHGASAPPAEIPIRVVVNGVTTVLKAQMKEDELLLQAQAAPIDRATKRGWGRVELPADSLPFNNVFHFVFDEPAVRRSVILTDDASELGALGAALSAASSPDPAGQKLCTFLPVSRAPEIPWEEAAVLVWHAPLPSQGDALARQLQEFVEAGRTVIFLPTEAVSGAALFGLRWGAWQESGAGKPQTVEWWRNDSDLLANTREGSALPVGSLEVTKNCSIEGEGVPLARLTGHAPLVMRAAETRGGHVYFLGALPGAGSSSLARDGVVLFAMVQRALEGGAATLGKAQQRLAGIAALGSDPGRWKPVDATEGATAENLALRAGVVTSGEQMVALNRPPGEDQAQRVSENELAELFAGLDYRVLTDRLEDTRSLTNEVWRTFLTLMAIAMVGEALLCMPPKRGLARPAFGRSADIPAAETLSRP